MAKEDFKNFVVKQVELQWPRLNQPYRYNNNERRTEACEPTAKNASYSVSWTMDTDDEGACADRGRGANAPGRGGDGDVGGGVCGEHDCVAWRAV